MTTLRFFVDSVYLIKMMIMEILYVLIVAVVSALLVYVFVDRYYRNKCNDYENEMIRLNSSIDEKDRCISSRDAEFLNLKYDMQIVRDEKDAFRAQSERLAAQVQMLEQQGKDDKELLQNQFDKQLRLVQEQLQSATEQLLIQREKQLTDTNKLQMDAIISPLKETIGEMKKTVEASRESHTKESATLEQQIRTMMERSADIGQKADNLANALRNNNPKLQGNWGELVLNQILESQGLVKGKHFDVQTTLLDEQGNALLNEENHKMIPDVIVHYPDGKDVVIDSKASLTAFVDYQNAETDEARALALKNHLTSVRSHVDELSKKNYSKYVVGSRQFINYVIMFIPNEMAMQLALMNDNQLWSSAFAKGVFITSEQNLIALLRMIELAWTQVEQNKNQAEIIHRAEELLNRVSDFIQLYEDLGKKIQSVSDCYIKTEKKLYSGNQSIVNGAHKLQDLGLKTDVKKSLPDERL